MTSSKPKTFNRTRLPEIAAFIVMIWLVAAVSSTAYSQTFNVLYNFGANPGDPSEAEGLLAQGRDGNLYGASINGGIKNLGVVFAMTPAGGLTVLYSFDGTHGAHPYGGLTLGTDGNFYGTTAYGGTFNDGTVFNITADGKVTVLHNFRNSVDGETPWSAPIQGADGNFYGTTCGCPNGGAFAGTVYKLTPSGKLTTLHHFGPNAYHDGVNPQSALVQGTDGMFYGMTTNQGTSNQGTIFRITSSGKFTTIHEFDRTHGGDTWIGTYARLVQGSDGTFYAPAPGGGQFGDGVVYKVAPCGKYAVVHNFDGNDGATGDTGLMLALDGNFYGVAAQGGSSSDGTIYSTTPNGTFSMLYDFDGTTGILPLSSVQHTNGVLFGDTYSGGTYGDGTFYSLNAGLAPFVILVPPTNKVGQTVGILGQGFTGTTSVSFSGTAATFTVDSDTFLEATVPDGATTGTVTVTTPGATLTSNLAFRVRPQILSFTPTSGPVGTPVTITGDSLTQTSRVAFDHVKAEFTVNSDTQVTATVPTGAQTGSIEITTPGGWVASKGVFTVTQ